MGLQLKLLWNLPRAFRTEIHLGTDDKRKDDGAAQHETPSEVRPQTAERDSHDVAEHDTWTRSEAEARARQRDDTKGRPHLPLHDQRAADWSWSALGRVNWDS
jgi:hypothetical protein